MPNFPESHELDISAFSRTLGKENTTTVNKFLWLLSILAILQNRNFNGNSSNEIPFDDISRRMVEMAIPPLYRFRLRFGRGEGKGADHTKRNLDNIFKHVVVKDDMPTFDTTDMYVRQKFNKEIRPQLERYVPYRWLTPFFQKELKGEKEWEINSAIEKLASDRFSSESPAPYRIVGKGENAFIEFNDAWKKYIVSNMEFIRGWAMWKWANFLQDRNPGVPSVVNKLAISYDRPPTSDQRNFWNEILRCKKEKEGGEFSCIYSGYPITDDGDYHLDHYIPWSYIGHCHLWNLVPVVKEVNANKGSKLPDTDKYLRPLVRAQYDALQMYREHFPPKLKNKWEYLMAAYYEDLSLPAVEPVCVEHLYESYKNVIESTIAIAKSRFTPNWEWDSSMRR